MSCGCQFSQVLLHLRSMSGIGMMRAAAHFGKVV